MTDRAPAGAAPFCTRGRDVRPRRRAVEELHQMRGLAALRQYLEECLEHAGAAEPPEPLPDAVPVSVFLGQRTPSDVVDRKIVDRLEEFAIVMPGFPPGRLRRVEHLQRDRPIPLRHPRQHDRPPVAGHPVIRTRPDSRIPQKRRSGIPSTRPSPESSHIFLG